MWPQYPESPYGTDIDLSDWGWLFDLPDQQLGYTLGQTIPWGYQAPAPLSPYVSATAPMGGGTLTPDMTWSGGLGNAGGGGGAGGGGFPPAEYPIGWTAPGMEQYPRGMGVAPGGSQYESGQFGAVSPPGQQLPGRFLMPGEVTPQAQAAVAASDRAVQQQMAPYNAQVASKQEVVQTATPGLPGHDAAWEAAFRREHGMGWQEYYNQPQHNRGAGSPEDALYRDYVLSQQYMGMTGKKSLTPGDWRNIYYGVVPGGGGGGGGAAPAPAPAAPTPVAPPYQIAANPYFGPQTRITMPSGALGQVGAPARDIFEQVLRGQGWTPSGVLGEYGWGEYTRPEPANVWLEPELFNQWGGVPGQQARWLMGERGWGRRFGRP